MQLCFLPLRFNAAEILLVFQLHISATAATFLQFCNSQQPCEKPPSNPIQPALKQKKKLFILICLSSSFFPPHFFTSLLRCSRTGSCKNGMHFHLNPSRCHHSSNICTFFSPVFLAVLSFVGLLLSNQIPSSQPHFLLLSSTVS